jgi:hypothetical protein
MEPETLLQAFGVEYDPRLLGRNRIMFSYMLRKYMAHTHCRDESLFEGSENALDRGHPMHSLVRFCVESAWADLADMEKRKGFADEYGGGCSSGDCGSSESCSTPAACGSSAPGDPACHSAGCGPRHAAGGGE